MRIEIFLGTGVVLTASGCGTYLALTPEAQAVVATTIKPAGSCKSLGALTGKGGGASGAYVSNESLIEYAVNDLRNQAATIGATHVVYTPPAMGGNGGTTTSAMVTGEALRCEAGGGTSTAAEPVASSAPALAPVAEPASPGSGGCDYDTQCKGDRVCVNRACVEPGSSSKLQSATVVEAGSAKPGGVAAPNSARSTSP
jgi:hypothetical protein